MTHKINSSVDYNIDIIEVDTVEHTLKIQVPKIVEQTKKKTLL